MKTIAIVLRNKDKPDTLKGCDLIDVSIIYIHRNNDSGDLPCAIGSFP